MNRPCPPGFYRKRNGDCALVDDEKQLAKGYVETPSPKPKPKRCPKGTRKNKSGDCVRATTKSINAVSDAPLPKPNPKKCPKRTRKNKSGDCVPGAKPTNHSQHAETVIAVNDVTTIADDLLSHHPNIKIQNPSIQYLLELINKHTASELRARNAQHDLMLPFERYSTDKALLLYLLREIIEMSINRTRDSKKKLVSVKTIQDVIQHDDQFRQLFSQ
jgi:hypothetical protein